MRVLHSSRRRATDSAPCECTSLPRPLCTRTAASFQGMHDPCTVYLNLMLQLKVACVQSTVKALFLWTVMQGVYCTT